MSKTCVFVDGGYLQKVLEKCFARARVDFGRLGPELARAYEPYLRSYYYNCLPYQSAKPTREESALVANAQRFYARLNRIPDLDLRLGRLAFRGTSRNTGKPIFEQKRVDVLLAVDLMTLAFSHQMATAVVIAGDSDFVPVFAAVKLQGVRVVLVHGTEGNPPHEDLKAAADHCRVIDADLIDRIRLGAE